MPCILIAEDSPTQAEQLKLILESAGFDTEVAVDAETAIAHLAASSFDMVISDINMPGLSGYELCRRIKAEAAWKHIPVILLTTGKDPMDIFRGLDCGADNFYTKPYDSDRLMERVRNIFSNRRLRAPENQKTGVEVSFSGQKFIVASEKEQILDLLVSTFADVVQANIDLEKCKGELMTAKAKVEEYARIAHDFSNILMVIEATADELQKDDGLDPHLRNRIYKIGQAAEQATELLRGEIGLESQGGRGSTFRNRAPMPEASTLQHPDETSLKPVISARILVAEDLEIIQELIRHLLERAGHQVDVVSDGAEAVTAVQAQSYDLVLMDIQMPGMNGITAAKEIRALQSLGRDIPIIAMTANVLPQQARNFKEAGMNDYLSKPVKGQDLLKKLSEWLPGRDVERAASPAQSARILVVDDLEIIQKLALSILESVGYQVDLVSDGGEAVAAVQEKRYDLVLMDIEMPKMDGITATKAIRALQPPMRDVPIIAMTVRLSPQQVSSYEDAGMNGHVGKPLKRKSLLENIHEWLPTSAAVLATAPNNSNPARPFFDQSGFDEFRNMMGTDRVASWLTQLNELLESTFSDDRTRSNDRPQMGRSAHAIVSMAACLGFAELAQRCSELDQACTSGKELSLALNKARSAARTASEMIAKLSKRQSPQTV